MWKVSRLQLFLVSFFFLSHFFFLFFLSGIYEWKLTLFCRYFFVREREEEEKRSEKERGRRETERKREK